MMKRLLLNPGREKSLLRRHPWIFSGAVRQVEGEPLPGETLMAVDHKGRFLAYISYSPASQITGRVWSFDEKEKIDSDFFRRRVESAAALRNKLGLGAAAGGCRLIFSESDSLPGVIVDRFGAFLVLQLLSAGAEYHREKIIDALWQVCRPEGIYERSDARIRKKEQLPLRCELTRGKMPPEDLVIQEDDMLFSANCRHGQKTGFYFDLRSARRKVREMASGARVLNCFSYTGAFAVAALKGGAESVLNIDSSMPALQQIPENVSRNGFDIGKAPLLCGDVFELLRKLDEEGKSFDMVILDPPKLIDSQRNLAAGCRGYQDLARLGFKLLNPGGVLFNFSCSGLMTPELFQKITAAAALEAGCDAVIAGRLEQSPDHPTLLSVPETFYLNGLCSVKSF